MKKLNIVLMVALIALFVIVLAKPAFCADVTVSAQVPSTSPVITVTVKELTTPGQDPTTGATVTDMNFGQLTHTLAGGGEAGVWYSAKYYAVLIYTNSFGRQYEIRSTCAGLVSGSNNLPTGCFGVSPGYASADRWNPLVAATAQGTQPSGSTLGSAALAITGVGSFRSIYTSEPAASNRILRAFYSLPGYGTGGAVPFTGYTPIPLSQASGTYSGTVTITIAPI